MNPEVCLLKELGIYLKKYRKQCILAPLFKLLEVVFELTVPLVVASVIDKGIPAGDSGHVIRMCIVLGVLGLTGLLSAVTAQWFAANAAIGFAADLRHALLKHLQTLSWADLDRLGTSTVITRMTGDINQLQTGVNMGLRLLLRSPFVVFGAMIMAFTVDAHCALIFLAVIAVLFAVVFGILLMTLPRYKKVQSHLDQVTAATRENLNGIRVLRAFRMEESQKEAFEQKNGTLTKSQLKVGRLSALMNPLTYAVINIAILLLMRSGALRVDAGYLTQGQVIALYNYMSQILVELVKLANLIITLTRAAASGKRVSAVMRMESSQPDGTKVPAPDAPHGQITFDRVRLSYNDTGDPALEEISFTAAPGETIGIIGGTGSGKTSLVHLIPRFYDATAGRVSVDGLDVKDFRKADLRRRIAIVPQKATLFQGTIRSNLRWGNPDATDAELWQALRIAQAEELVRDREQGLDAKVEQGGRNFSGGQRQRLTIARALLKKPEILILDDAASALDFATDAALRKALRNMPDAPTTLIVSQRTSGVRFADKIIVLEDGIAAGTGTHEELLENCSVYREIHLAQFGGEEAACHA